MPSCVVKCCKNNTTSQTKCQGITFHRFPTANKPWNDDWIEIIRNCRGEDHWMPSKTSVVCSIHFDGNDLYATKNGLRRVVTYAVPKILLFVPPDIEEQPVEPKITIASQKAHKLSSPERSPIIAADFQQPLSSGTTSSSSSEPPLLIETVPIESWKSLSTEGSVSLSLTLPLSQPPPIIETVHGLSKQLLSCKPSASLSLSLSSSQLFPIGAPSSASTAPNFKESLVLDTPRIRNLKEALKNKQSIIAAKDKKIKVLNQKIRRLRNRNSSLKYILKTVKKQNYVDTDLFNRLKLNYNKDKTKKPLVCLKTKIGLHFLSKVVKR